MSVSIGCNGTLPPYYGARSATYFQQIAPVRLGDGPQLALAVQGNKGLHSQAGRRRGEWVGDSRSSHSTPSMPYCTNRATRSFLGAPCLQRVGSLPGPQMHLRSCPPCFARRACTNCVRYAEILLWRARVPQGTNGSGGTAPKRNPLAAWARGFCFDLGVSAPSVNGLPANRDQCRSRNQPRSPSRSPWWPAECGLLPALSLLIRLPHCSQSLLQRVGVQTHSQAQPRDRRCCCRDSRQRERGCP